MIEAALPCGSGIQKNAAAKKATSAMGVAERAQPHRELRLDLRVERGEGASAGTLHARLDVRQQVRVLEARLDRRGARERVAAVGHEAHVHAVGAADQVRDVDRLLRLGEALGGDDRREDAAGGLAAAAPRACACATRRPCAHDGDLRGDRLDVRDDVRREDDDAPLRDLGEQVAEAHALLGIEADGRLVHDHELRDRRAAPARCRRAAACRPSSRRARRSAAPCRFDELEQLLDAPVEVSRPRAP